MIFCCFLGECRWIIRAMILVSMENRCYYKDKLILGRNRYCMHKRRIIINKSSGCGLGWLFCLLGSLLLISFSSRSSPSALWSISMGLIFSLSSHFSSSILDHVLILSLLVLPEYNKKYFHVRGTTSSVKPKNSVRYFLPSLLMK